MKYVDEIKDVIHDYHGLDLTDEQVVQLMLDNPSVLGEVAEWGAIDTCVRERIADIISEKCTGMAWVCGGDPKELQDEWFCLMKENAPKFGYKFTEHSLFNG